MKQKILIASANQEIIEKLNYLLLTLDYSATIKKLKTIWVVYIPECEFYSALMSLAPFVETLSCSKNLFWALNNKKQGTFENIIAIANEYTLEEFTEKLQDESNQELSN